MAKQRQKRRPDVPRTDHVARHCNHQRIIRDPTTKEIKGVFPQAFELRVKIGEKYLSLNWFEFFGGTVPAQYQAIVAALRDKRNLTPRCGIIRLNAAGIMDAGAARGLSLRLRDRSSPKNPGYVGLEGIPQDNSDIHLLVLLANKAFVEVRTVGEIDALTP